MGEVMANPLKQLAASAEPLLYRLGAYFTLSLLDDPAILALAFC